MGKFFMQVCRDNGLKVQYQHLFDRLTLPEFLKGKVCFLTVLSLSLNKNEEQFHKDYVTAHASVWETGSDINNKSIAVLLTGVGHVKLEGLPITKSMVKSYLLCMDQFFYPAVLLLTSKTLWLHLQRRFIVCSTIFT